MKIIKTYKLFESREGLIKFKDEVKDYLSNLTDSNFMISSSFYDNQYVLLIEREDPFICNDIQSDVNRFIQMSSFKLIRIFTSLVEGEDYEKKSILEIPDNEELTYIHLYFTK